MAVVCRVCQKQFAKYTCPRCNLRYCSLPCYRSHSLRCVESFSRDNIVGEMQHLGATPETRRRTMEALKRFHLESVEDDGLEEDACDEMGSQDHVGTSILSEKVLEKVAAGEDIELDDLTHEEKVAFFHSVASGELSHMIKPWEPWWLNHSARTLSLTRQGNRLVQPVEECDKNELDDLNDREAPEIPAPLQSPLHSIDQLTAVQPSPLLRFHLVEVVYSYCFTLRLFNGEWHSDCLDAAVTCLSVSRILGQGAAPESLTEALSNCLEMVCSAIFRPVGSCKFGVALLDDVLALLLLGRPGVICLFADLYRLLKCALEQFNEDDKAITGQEARDKSLCTTQPTLKGSDGIHSKGSKTCLGKACKSSFQTGRTERKRIKAASKKVYFLMCWANEQSDDSFTSLAFLVEAEKAGLSESERSMSSELMKTKDFQNKMHLIQEI